MMECDISKDIALHIVLYHEFRMECPDIESDFSVWIVLAQWLN
jgi:hypothetical protein